MNDSTTDDPFGIRGTLKDLRGVDTADPAQIRQRGDARGRSKRIAAIAGAAVCALIAGLGINAANHQHSTERPDIAVPSSASPSAGPSRAASSAPASPSMTPSPTTPAATVTTVQPGSTASNPGGTAGAPRVISQANLPTAQELYFRDPGDTTRTVLPNPPSEGDGDNASSKCMVLGGDGLVNTDAATVTPEALVTGKYTAGANSARIDDYFIVQLRQYATPAQAAATATMFRRLLQTCAQSEVATELKIGRVFGQGQIPVKTSGVTVYDVTVVEEITSDQLATIADVLIIQSGNRVALVTQFATNTTEWHCVPLPTDDIAGQCLLPSKANLYAQALVR